MRGEQQIVLARDLLDAAVRITGRDDDPDYRMILTAYLDVLSWVLELEEGQIFQSIVQMQGEIADVHAKDGDGPWRG